MLCCIWRKGLFLIFVCLLGTTRARADEAVDMALVMAVDVSGSISDNMLDFELAGHAAAFREASLRDAIGSGPHHRIGVTLVSWSSPGSLHVLVPWRIIANAADAEAMAAAILKAPREFVGGSTAVGRCIEDSAKLFAASGLRADRKVIDIASNGFSNAGIDPAIARDKALAQGIIINGLVILDEYNWLEEYYGENVIGGLNSFVRTARDRNSFSGALLAKLLQEVAMLPKKTSLAANALP